MASESNTGHGGEEVRYHPLADFPLWRSLVMTKREERDEERKRRRERLMKIERQEELDRIERSTRYTALWFWQDGTVVDEWEIHDGFVAIPNVGEVVHLHRGEMPEGIYRKNSPTLFALGSVVRREFEYYSDFFPDAPLHQHRDWQVVHLFLQPVDPSDVGHLKD